MPHACSITSSPRCDLAERVRKHLAVLGGEEGGEVLAALVRRARECGRAAPCGGRATTRARPGRPPRPLDCPADLLDRGEVDLAGLPAGGRVVDGAAAARLAGDDRAADPVADSREPLVVLRLQPASARLPSSRSLLANAHRRG